MEEVAVQVVADPHPSSTYQQTSFTLLPQLTQAVQGTASAPQTGGHPGWPLLPHGPPSAHPEQTTGS